MKLRSAALTDIGRVRRKNEDSYLQDDALCAYGVADGVGGLPGGADASQATIASILSTLVRRKPSCAADMVPLVLRINDSVSRLGDEISPGVGIGTTLTFGVFTATHLLLAHVGDSRCYRARNGTLELLTEDHSVENEARRRRARGESFDYADRYRNALTRCIGQPTDPEVDVSEHRLAAGDAYLFATDGVARVVEEDELQQIIAQPGSLESRLATLIERANAQGGPDNATAVLVAVEELP